MADIKSAFMKAGFKAQPTRPEDAKYTPWNPAPWALKRVKNAIPAPTSCPHCQGDVEIVNNKEIYGRPYGDWPWAYRCKSKTCDSYVGMHPMTNIPLGTLANAELRNARKMAKNEFHDMMTEAKWTRDQAYAHLAKEMGLKHEECHFGWFTIEQCRVAWKISRNKNNELAKVWLDMIEREEEAKEAAIKAEKEAKKAAAKAEREAAKAAKKPSKS